MLLNNLNNDDKYDFLNKCIDKFDINDILFYYCQNNSNNILNIDII